jgi:hypothetical protein
MFLNFFKELSRYTEGILQLECLIKREKLMVKQIEENIKDFRLMFTRKVWQSEWFAVYPEQYGQVGKQIKEMRLFPIWRIFG